MSEDEHSGSAIEWRVTGVRRWHPALLVTMSLLIGVGPAVRFATRAPSSLPRAADVLSLVVIGALFIASVVLLVVVRRTRVVLGATGIEIRAARRKIIAYEEIERAYRSRWSMSLVSLSLKDGRATTLPAPTRGPGSDDPVLDDAVDQISSRLGS